MKLVIFGANGPSGRLLVQRALAEGHEVSAVTRHPDTFPIRHDHLRVLAGDAYNSADVQRAVIGQDAVLSVLGNPYSWKPVRIYSEGTANIVAAMRESNVRRLVVASSGGVGRGIDLRNEGIVFGLIIKRTIGRTSYVDFRRMEDLVTRSDLDWTIVRPAQLVDTSVVSDYRVAEGLFVPGMSKTARIDLADLMLKEAVSPRFSHKAVAVATVM